MSRRAGEQRYRVQTDEVSGFHFFPSSMASTCDLQWSNTLTAPLFNPSAVGEWSTTMRNRERWSLHTATFGRGAQAGPESFASQADIPVAKAPIAATTMGVLMLVSRFVTQTSMTISAGGASVPVQ